MQPSSALFQTDDRRGRRGSTSKTRLPRAVALCVLVVVYLGLIANQNVTDLLAAGRRLDLSDSTSTIWQYIREAVLLFLSLSLVLFVGRVKRRNVGRILISPWSMLFGVYISLQVLRALVDPESDLTTALLGLRFVYIALIAYAIQFLDGSQRAELVRIVATGSMIFLVIQAVIATGQVLNGPPVLGATFLGSRPWGTYSSANNLGVAVVAIAVLIAISAWRHRFVLLLPCLAVAVSTGSRTAILGVLLVLVGLVVSRWAWRAALAPLGLILFIAVYEFSSTAQVSGRVIEGEARFDVWKDALSVLDSPLTVFLGKGLGYGSNAVTVAFGSASLGSRVAVADSTFLSMLLSLGVVGLLFLAGAIVTVARQLQHERKWVILGPLLIIAVSFNAAELSPVNVLFAVAIGVSLGSSAGKPGGLAVS